MTAVPELPPTSDRDDLDEFLEEELQDPAFAAALEDAEARSRLILQLVAFRKRASATQALVAAVMETTQSAISDLENAGTDPRLSTLQRYARAVGARITFSVEPVEAARLSRVSFSVERFIEAIAEVADVWARLGGATSTAHAEGLGSQYNVLVEDDCEDTQNATIAA